MKGGCVVLFHYLYNSLHALILGAAVTCCVLFCESGVLSLKKVLADLL